MYLDILNILLGFLLLLFAPGFSLSLALFPRKEIDIFERISLSIVSSISLNVLSIFFLNYFIKFPVTISTLVVDISLMILLFTTIYLLRTGGLPRVGLKKYEGRDDIKKFLRVSCILILLIINFLLVYDIHKDYPYPFISDEWHHIAQGVQIVDKKGINLQNPYYKERVEFLETGFFEIGFHVFLAEIFLLTGKDPVLFYVYLPAIFSCITSFILFTFIYKITKNFYSGLLSMIFFAGLKSNINILGPWFFIPLTLGFAFIYLIFYLTTTGLEKNSFISLALSAFILLSLALIHPWSASFILPVVAIYLLLRPKLISKNLPGVLVLFLVPLSSFIYVFRILWRGSFTETLRYFIVNFLIRSLEIPVKEVGHYSYLLNFYGFIPILLAFIAILYITIKNKKQEKILLVWIFLMSLLIILFQWKGLTLLAPYERIFYYTLLSLVPLSAIGLFGVLNLINSKIKIRSVSIPILTICIIIVVFSLFSDYDKGKNSLYRIIDKHIYSALKWLEKNRGNYNVVLSRPEISSAVYPIAKNYVVSINPAQLGHSLRGLYDNKWFFMSDCHGKKEILEKYDVDYVLVEKDDRMGCEFLREIYYKKGVYIYEVQW